jgi:hypothetical protein
MSLAAILAVVHAGSTAIVPAATAFVGGMYFGTLIGGGKE